MWTNPFAHHVPGPTAKRDVAKLREKFAELHDLVKEVGGQGREVALAVTNLEQAAMWANKAVVKADPESAAE